MEKNLETVVKMFEKYNGNGMHIILMAVSLIFLLFFLKDEKIKKILWGYTLLFVFIYGCPLTAGIIIKNIGRSVYWRMFWTLPSEIIIAFAFAYLIDRVSYKWLKGALLIGLSALIGITGSAVFLEGSYEAEANRFKLPLSVPTVCEIIKEDADEQEIDTIKVIVPNDLLSYIRQYDAGFYMPYGRNALRGDNLSENQQELFGQMNALQPNYYYFDELLANEGCTYLVWKVTEEYDVSFEELGYEVVNQVDSYRIYRIS